MSPKMVNPRVIAGEREEEEAFVRDTLRVDGRLNNRVTTATVT